MSTSSASRPRTVQSCVPSARITDPRGALPRVFWGVFLGVFMWAPGVVAESLQAPPPTLTASGRASIYHDDLAGARERAVQAALVRGLERYAGLRIEASTLIKKVELIDREVRAHTHGYVKAFEVLASHRDGKELVVTVRLTVAEEPVAASFRRLLSATTTLLLAREHNLGLPVRGQILPAILADPFFESALLVPPAERLADLASRVSVSYYEKPDPETTRELGLRWLAGLILVASADTRAMDSGAESLGYAVEESALRPVVEAFGNVTILEVRSGRTIAARRFDDIRGSDASSEERAGREALGRLAGEMRAFVMETLSTYVRDLGFPLRVVVRGRAAAGGAKEVIRVLESTRWVVRVEVAREEEGRTVLEATCRENPFYIVEELRHATEVEILRYDRARAEVEVR